MTAHRESEFRRGWRVVLAAAVGVGVGLSGLPFYTFGTFVKPLSDAFGWSRAEISAGALFLVFGSLMTAPLVGRLADRLGVRRIGLTALAGLAIGFVGLTAIGGSIWNFYLGWLMVALAGAGTSPIVWTRAVTTWFDRSRGLALGLTLLGTGIAGMLGPRFVGLLIAWNGWRAGYLGMAAIVAAGALPIVAALFFERRDHTAGSGAAPVAIGLTAREAARTRHFWMLGLGMFLVSLGIGSAIVHLVPLMTDRGFAVSDATALAGLLGGSVVIARIGVGLLVDHFHAPRVALVLLMLPAIACLLLTGDGRATWIAALAAVLFGVAAGAEVDLIAYLTNRYFGFKAYGEIYGWQLAFFGLGAGLGPTLTGRVRDVAGGYEPALYAGAALFVIGALLIGALGPYPTLERPVTLAAG